MRELIGDLSSAQPEYRAELLALLRRFESARYTHIPEPVYEIGEMIRRHAPVPDDDATAAAWAVWHAVPELDLMASARDRCKHAKSLLGTLRELVLHGPDPAFEIGDPDTTIADALRLEAERIGHAPMAGEGEHQVGYRAAYAGFVKQMAHRARELEGLPERNPRRGVLATTAPSADPTDSPTPVLVALRDAVAALPHQRDARRERWTARVTNAIEPLHPGVDPTALGRAIVADLPELDRLDETLGRLERIEEQLAATQRRLAAQRAHLTEEVIRWRNALARELRQQADHHVAATGISLDADFTAGFTLASDQIARHLRERADRLAVADLPKPSFPMTRARDAT